MASSEVSIYFKNESGPTGEENNPKKIGKSRDLRRRTNKTIINPFKPGKPKKI